ncbi:hypothetical protein ACFX4N_23900 [Priestia sp. YIM B13551]|uniref:hypothetical protein n=1 Tax=Priestia sp. YIM B13551 TaxID=3366306 RepID=UPI0036735EEA
MSKHHTFTPGPWNIGRIPTTVISPNTVETTRKYTGSPDGGVNDVEHYGGSLIAESVLRRENAHLIAAAPNMYDVLVNLLAVEEDHELECVIEEAKKAIAKANGWGLLL